MKYVSLFLAMVICCLTLAFGVSAQQTNRCDALLQRLDRQKLIDAAFECNVLAGDDGTRFRKRAQRRCTRNLRRQLSRRWSRQSHKIEQCVERHVRQAALRAEAAAADKGRNSVDDAKPLTRRIEGGVIRQRSARRGSAGLVERLLRGRLAQRDGDEPRSDSPQRRDSTFRSGLAWSYAGPLPGMHCVQWKEPSDPHDWKDNYLCTEKDVGFQWSFRGPILGRGLKCIQVNEKSDPHDWHDNYFCWPRDLKVTFRFSSTGRIDGYRCLAIVEPSDPHTWRDNYLCHRPSRG